MIKSFKGTTVLITGASSGIGEAFARNLAARGANLILSARSEDKLVRIAEELKRKHPISVQVFPADLSGIEAPERLFEQIKENHLSVNVLINNAGFGKWAHFLAEDPDTYQKMLFLNINALVRLTHLYLPEMLSRGTGGVINVASTAAFQPLPFQAVYGASKAFVLNFTEALSGEYRERGLRFLALCPGNTATNFFAVANADASGMSFATPLEVAAAGLNAFLRGRSYHVPGVANYLKSLLPRVFPRTTVVKIAASMFKSRIASNKGI